MKDLVQQAYLQSLVSAGGNPVVAGLLAESGEDPFRIAKAISQPNWSDFYGSGWQDYIPLDVQAVWDKLPLEAKVIAYRMASLRWEEEEEE